MYLTLFTHTPKEELFFFFLKVFLKVGGKIHVTNFEVGNRQK